MTRLRGRPLVQTSSTSTSSSSALNYVQGDSSSSSTNNKDEAAAEAAAADALTLENAAVVALAAWSQSVAECEFFHADVHGGNLLLLGVQKRLPLSVSFETLCWCALSPEENYYVL